MVVSWKIAGNFRHNYSEIVLSILIGVQMDEFRFHREQMWTAKISG